MSTIPTPRAVIFDLDGTLLDTLDDLADSANEALTTAGLPTHPVDSYRTFVGEGINVLVQQIIPPERCDDDTLAKVILLYRAAYGKRWNRKTVPYPGIVEMLSTLKSRGILMAVLSNKPQAFTTLCIDHHLRGHAFHPILGQRESVPRKPHPAGALEIAATLSVAPGECLFIGDTKIDMETAVRAGMIPIGVSWGFRPVEELTGNGARQIVHSPAEIVALCGA